MQHFLDELKRRNIIRVATVYAVASWVILQLCDVVFPGLDIPEEDIRYVIVVLFTGFPLTMVFAWLFELTPQGLQRSGEVETQTSITARTGRRIDFIIIGLLSVALVFFMSEYFLSNDAAEQVSQKATNIAADSQTQTPKPTEKPSIAVLPLMNMSSDAENEHFADGLTEELLNVLARNPELRVAGRTSSFFYKGKNLNLKEIGDDLNVTNILEGSVRKSGDTVRVTAQLINAKTGFHLWSDTFDRQVTDIFAIQDEIASKVAAAMNLTLLKDNLLPGSTTRNPEAHDLFLQAKSLLYDRRRESVDQSIELFKKSSELDPSYGLPILGLAEAVMVAQNNFNVYTLTESTEIAGDALNKAASIGFMPSEYYSTLGLLNHHMTVVEYDAIPRAVSAYEQAVTLNPNNINAYIWYSTLLTDLEAATKEVDSINRLDKAIELNQKALSLDPRNRVANSNYQANLTAAGRFDEAISNLEGLIKNDPDYSSYSSSLGFIHYMLGDFSQATEIVSAAEDMSSRESYMLLSLLFSIDRLDDIVLLHEATSDDNPAYERISGMVESRNATTAELIAKAKVALLKPDYDNWSRPIAFWLHRKREFDWSRQVLENINPEYAKETPNLLVNGDTAEYASTLFLSGDIRKAQSIAEYALVKNRNRFRLGNRGKHIEDAHYYIILNRSEEAIIELEAAYADGWRHYYFGVHQDPIFDEITGDPRVREVRRKTDEHIAQHMNAIEKNLARAGVLVPIEEAD